MQWWNQAGDFKINIDKDVTPYHWAGSRMDRVAG